MLLSIIVPIYNAEKYLENTILSVIKQSFTDWQLILVNDGSADKTEEICRRFSKKDNRIVYISQRNSGPSKARNTGIKIARGDYVMFLDSDDEYMADAFERICNKIRCYSPDMIVSSSKIFDCDLNVVISKEDYYFDDDCISGREFCDMAVKMRLAPAPWRYVIKREIIAENCVFFPEDLIIAEDCVWLCRLAGHISTVVTNSSPFYQYNIHSNSITTSFSFEKTLNHIKACEYIFNLAQGQREEVKKFMHNYCCILANSMLQHYFEASQEEKRLIKKGVKENNQNFKTAIKIYPPIKMLSYIVGTFNSMLLFAQIVKVKNKFLS